ncbi:hypothetical protein TNCV_4408131 [Trichonephila clavipes]|nr:hypothetical protein TNCV_4408131 [Trichonephila clavipes]
MANGTPKHLISCIRQSKTNMLPSGVILQDNARPHVKVCVEGLTLKIWEVLEKPAYSPDLSPCNCHIFGPLKGSLMDQQFHSGDNVKAAVLRTGSSRTEFAASQAMGRLNAMGDFLKTNFVRTSLFKY